MLKGVLHIALQLLNLVLLLLKECLLVFEIDLEGVVLVLLSLHFRLHLVELQFTLFLLGFSLLHFCETAVGLTLCFGLDFHFSLLGFNDFLILYLFCLQLGIVDDAVAAGFRYHSGYEQRGNHT